MPFSYQAGKWYRAEVTWVSATQVEGRLYDSDGVTQLALVQLTAALAPGGVAVRTFGGAMDDLSTYVTPQFTITTASLGTSQVCAGQPLAVSYTATGVFAVGNAFTAQLSDASGSFASPVVIGTRSGTGSGTIAATIPATTLPGTGYRVRVVSSVPAVTGTDNGSNLTINSVPTSSASTTLSTIYLGYGPQTATLTATGGATYTWAANQTPAYLSGTTGSSLAFAPQAGGTYIFTVTATSAAGCSASTGVTVVVNDVRCGNKNDKVTVCHNGQALCVATPAVAAHLAHGDQLGECAPNSARSTAAAGNGVNGLAIYPNPATEGATVAFRPATTGAAQVEVYNHFGQRVATLYQGAVNAGQYYGLRLDSHALASGMYVCRLVLNGHAETRQITVTK